MQGATGFARAFSSRALRPPPALYLVMRLSLAWGTPEDQRLVEDGF